MPTRVMHRGEELSGYLMPGHAAALQVFASHNSDLGGNEHDFRREESEQIRPALDRL